MLRRKRFGVGVGTSALLLSACKTASELPFGTFGVSAPTPAGSGGGIAEITGLTTSPVKISLAHGMGCLPANLVPYAEANPTFMTDFQNLNDGAYGEINLTPSLRGTRGENRSQTVCGYLEIPRVSL